MLRNPGVTQFCNSDWATTPVRRHDKRICFRALVPAACLLCRGCEFIVLL